MAETRYFVVSEVVGFHNEIMELTGFNPAPLRDERLLESAIMRPQMAAYYEGADLIRQAALLAIGISQTQAFMDGNKRTAFLTTDVFLYVNGLLFTGDSVEFAQGLEAVASREGSLLEATDNFEIWLREHVEPREVS